MTVIFKLNETGVTFRVNTGVDMSSNTELEIVFINPAGTATTKASADGVTLGTVNVTDDDLGALLANKYVEYEIESGLLATAGTNWRAYARYTNTGSTPTDYFIGDTVQFTVHDPANTTKIKL